MDADFSRSSIPSRKDPHEWNTWDHYQTIHENRLDVHPFVDRLKPHTLVFTEIVDEGVIRLDWHVFCLKNTVLEVEKYLETQHFVAVLRVRGLSYRYAAWVPGHNQVLRYHNIHERDDHYHHRVFNWRTGEEIYYETLERYQFPTFSEVLDEVEHAVTLFE